MTKDEALKLALNWAETHGEIVFAGGGMDAVNKMNFWVAAIKEALAQTQEPWCMKMNDCKTKCEDCPDDRGTHEK